MKTAAIIAEYNPFHNGHAYQMEVIRNTLHADYIIVIMSPDFVQRGEYAVLDQHVRTRMALNAGADLVLSLPVCFAAGASASFAEGAIRILNGLGCVDYLSFGCESPGSWDVMQRAARLLAEEPPRFRWSLREALAKGATFAEARAAALRLCFDSPDEGNELEELLSKPNNILAVDYLRALTVTGSAITPAPVLRTGSGYHDRQSPAENACPSAAYLRGQIAAGRMEDVKKGVPETVFPLFPKDLPQRLSGMRERYSILLHYALMQSVRASSLDDYLDVSEELALRAANQLPLYKDAAQFASLLKTRQYTEARIHRALLHVFLGIRKEQTPSLIAAQSGLYTRILGFRKKAAPLLHRMKEAREIPVVTKPASAGTVLPPAAFVLFRQDVYSSDLYRLLEGSTGQSEYTHSPAVL